MPTFTFIIPVKPGGHVAALESLRKLAASAARFEVLLAEGCSPSRQRNTAADQAQVRVGGFCIWTISAGAWSEPSAGLARRKQAELMKCE